MRLLRALVAVCLAPVVLVVGLGTTVLCAVRWVWTGSSLPARTPSPAVPEDDALRWVEQWIMSSRRGRLN